ncbi:MAG: DUF4136 domain-containing protein [Flavobacteriaceae bacterium]
MKVLKYLSTILLFTIFSCKSVKITSDYNRKIDFSKFKTFAFFEKGIDKVDLSDQDKQLILNAIEDELMAKGMTKSNHPDILVNIFTKSKEEINHYDRNNYLDVWTYQHYGLGNGPTYNNVSTAIVGTLFIDIIDTSKKKLAWQGVGVGFLNFVDSKEKKDKLFKEFATEIMKKYPPAK